VIRPPDTASVSLGPSRPGGRDDAEVIGRTIFDLFPSGRAERYAAALRATLAAATPATGRHPGR
jgi:hypothetical protein